MDKTVLFQTRLPEEDVSIPGVGTVRVRALSRAEVLLVRKSTDDEHMDGPRALVLERKLLAKALVDPALSEAEVGHWQDAATPGEIEPVVTVVQRLSGLLQESPKSGVQGVREPAGS